MTTVFPPQAAGMVAVYGSGDFFPVHRIYCVGRNYDAHAREMGATDREDPFFFSKPGDAVLNIADGQVGTMPYPSATQDLHHEIELVVALGSGGTDLNPTQAAACIWGHAIGLDMTRRDLQAAAKKAGRPWESSKAFDHSAPIGPLHPVTQTGPLTRGRIALSVNGEVRQQGDLADMIWSVPEAIAHLSTLFELKAGDLIFTGTPAGIGAVQPGDLMQGSIAGLGMLQVRIQG